MVSRSPNGQNVNLGLSPHAFNPASPGACNPTGSGFGFRLYPSKRQAAGIRTACPFWCGPASAPGRAEMFLDTQLIQCPCVHGSQGSRSLVGAADIDRLATAAADLDLPRARLL